MTELCAAATAARSPAAPAPDPDLAPPLLDSIPRSLVCAGACVDMREGGRSAGGGGPPYALPRRKHTSLGSHLVGRERSIERL